MITVKIYAKQGKDITTLIRNLDKESTVVLDGINVIGEETLLHMRNFINTNKKRKGKDPKNPFKEGNLANSIEKNRIIGKDEYGVGIGHIPTLQGKAPYWEIVDVGGYTPPAMRGTFGDGPPDSRLKGKGTAPFIVDKRFSFVHMSPIRPMHYIGGTITWLKGYWHSYWTKKR